MSSSVLAFLATRFATCPENLATEALNFFIANSTNARRALLDLCQQLGHQGSEDLGFTTQATNDDGARPGSVALSKIDENSTTICSVDFDLQACMSYEKCDE